MTTDRARAVNRLHEATAIYTSEPVVLELLKSMQWPRRGRRLLDSSCGDGAFVGAALERLLKAERVEDRDLHNRLAGWEIHPDAAEQARERITGILVANGRPAKTAARTARKMIRCADFLTEGPADGAWDSIAGNPPYLRFLNVPEPLRGEYKGIVPPHARADLLHSFIDRSAGLLSSRGELALVTADRWLFNESAAALREIVGARFGVAQLRRLDPASSFYRPKQRRAGSPPRIHPVAVVLKAGRGAQALGRGPIFPGDDGTCERFTTGRTLGDVAEVRLAPWLGTPGVFLLEAAVASEFPLSSIVPAVDTDDVVDGELLGSSRYALRTTPGVQPSAQVMAHIDRELPRMCARGRQRKERWIPPETFHGMDLSEPSLLVPRIAKSIRPIRVPAGVLPVNHNLSIVRSGSMSLDEIEEALSSRDSADWISRFAAPLESGYRSITTRLLRQLPMGAID